MVILQVRSRLAEGVFVVHITRQTDAADVCQGVC